MEKSEPTLVPQWYRTGGVSSSNSNSNHRYSPSTNSDDLGIGLYSRNRSTPSSSGFDSSQYPILSDTTPNPSYHRSRSFNGSLGYGSYTRSRAYNNFNKGYRDRGRDKNIGFHGKKNSNGLENGYNDHIDVFPVGKFEKDLLPLSQSKVVGKHLDSQIKRVGNDLNNGITSPKSLIGGIDKSSFERDFPSLCVEEKLQPPEIGRPPPTAVNAVSQGLPLGTSVTIGGKGWTSALAEVAPVIGGDGPVVSSSQQSTLLNSSLVAPSPNTGLNMAETVAKALSSTRLSPQLPDDTEKLAELAKRQLKTLIPVTPTTPKSSVNSSERLKTKGARTGNMSMPMKFASQTAQQVNYPNRGTARSDVPKAQQIGNFQVLNRERNSSISTANKVPGPTVTNKGRASAVLNSATSCNPKPKPDGLHGYSTEKRLSAQDRMSFFNTIRNGSSSNNSHQQQSVADSPTTEKDCEQSLSTPNNSVCHVKESPELDCHAVWPTMNSNGIKANHDGLVHTDTEKLLSVNEAEECNAAYSDIPDEEEIKFLRSLGWKEEGCGEEALTPEEIDAFVRESGHLLNSVKMSYCHHN